MIDQRALLADLQRQVRLLEDDVRERAATASEVAAQLEEEHRAALVAGRTAATFTEWREALVTQAAVAWVLGTVFVRFCEDNLLVEDAWLAGPGERTLQAEQRQTAYLIAQPHLNERDWLLAGFGHLADLPALAPLFDHRHNPLYRLAVSADGAEALIGFWRRQGDDGRVRHDFTDPELSTRFLGDLYQDLSEAARKMYALLQTPEFVEELILDLTLEPALETFGLTGLRLIDPTCGSGHFLLGAFDRLLDRWSREAPGTDLRERVQAALDSVHGVDVNPFATAIAKFRLTVAALRAEGLTRLADAPGYRLHLGTGDSLLFGKDDASLPGVEHGLASHQYATEDLAEHPGILQRNRYHVVVGNPPYITVKDKALNQAYRAGYETCHRQYALSVPFAELFFRLAVADPERPGYVGQITSNSFMKREFGTKLVEQFFTHQDLTHVIDTSGAYIPGHGTPTVILVGRRRIPRSTTLRAVLGIRGEPSAPADPANGFVWRSIVDHLTQPGFEDDFISVTDLPRERLASHPWSLSGGGADELFESIARAGVPLGPRITSSSRTTHTGSDDVFFLPAASLRSRGLEGDVVPVVLGEEVRDYRLAPVNVSVFPYDDRGEARDLSVRALRYLWPNRRVLETQLDFQQTRSQRGLRWFDHSMFFPERYRVPLSIAFAFVATHNHFVLDRGGKVFKQSAPVIKLPESATEDDHLALLGVLNSSTACFWLKQVSHNKGNGGIGGEIGDEDWEPRYEFTGTKLQEFPLPESLPPDRGRLLDELVRQAAESLPDAVVARGVPNAKDLREAAAAYAEQRARCIGEQEELDWEVYRRYGLIEEDHSVAPGAAPVVHLGERAFEIVLARKVAAGEITTAWFERHRSTPVTEIPERWPEEYRALVQRRIDLIESDPFIRLLERPEHKRRWADDPWEVKQERALRGWLLDRLEDEGLWRDPSGRPAVQSVAQLAGRLADDADFLSVLELWAGHVVSDVAVELGRLVADEHVPFLAAHRYKPSGLRVRQEWERTWDLQRQEDAGVDVGQVPVPPKYKPVDFVRPSYWRNRGKLDVPKERFISYPGAERGADTSLVLGWAGWDHAEQAMALAALVLARAQQDGWAADRLTPLLAGVAELEPWVHQWHAETDPRTGMSPAQAVTATLEQQLARLGLTRADLAAWRPAPPSRGRRAAKQEG